MFFSKNKWKANDGEYKYSAKIQGIKITLARYKGSRDSFGDRELLARHFLGREKWQDYARVNFGERALKQMNKLLTENQKQFDNIDTNI